MVLTEIHKLKPTFSLTRSFIEAAFCVFVSCAFLDKAQFQIALLFHEDEC